MEALGGGRDGLRQYFWPGKRTVAGARGVHQTMSNVSLRFCSKTWWSSYHRPSPLLRTQRHFCFPLKVLLRSLILWFWEFLLYMSKLCHTPSCLMPLPDTGVNSVWNVVSLQFWNELKITGLRHQSEFKIWDLGLASSEGNSLGGSEMAQRGCLCDSDFELASGPVALWLDRAHKENRQSFCLSEEGTHQRDLLPILKNNWAWNGYCLDYRETHLLISFFRITKGLMADLAPATGIWCQKISVTHLLREAVFRTKGISFISSFVFSFHSVPCIYGVPCMRFQLDLTERSGGETFQWPSPRWLPGWWWTLSGASRFLTQRVARGEGGWGVWAGERVTGGSCCREQDQDDSGGGSPEVPWEVENRGTMTSRLHLA